MQSEKTTEKPSKKHPKKQKYPYVILGGGSIGLAIAKEVAKLKKGFLIVDSEHTRVEALRDESYEAIEGDINSLKSLKEMPLVGSEGVFIMSSDFDANVTALKYIKNVSPKSFVMVRAIDLITIDDLYSEGADIVLHPPSIVADVALTELQKIEIRGAAWQLMNYLKSIDPSQKIGIVIHDNPDPDSIASGLALKNIADSLGKTADILYYGMIGHAENRAFVNLLDIPLIQVRDQMLSEYSIIALVDSNTPGKNNSLPPDTHVNIIIDHHMAHENTEIKSEFVDIRPDVGATSTIMTRYVQELDFELSSHLATALLYGIRTDTNEFKRNTSTFDLTAAAFLYSFAEHDLLSQIETPSMSAETLEVLGEAIRNKKIEGSYLLSNVGFIYDRDTLPQAADHLLKLEGISTVLVYGLTDEKIYVSARSKDIRINIGDIIQKSFGDIGSAGGHPKTAAAQIPLGVFSGVKDRDMLLKLTEEAVTRRFLSTVGIETEDE
ncbi:potassium transporter TrkA [Methanocella sp. CWC-04]|uniref:Potassium transporter TrkA n=1 Tax=Methanooceanicella nereidis TaxID=2052831 RepID=A0AAP2RCY8_9EURY|nr:potassium transporter TrkA [Methanocella sp. CWC-04]